MSTNLDECAALADQFGDEWREHPGAPSYYFSSCGRAGRVIYRHGTREAYVLVGCECGIGYRAISHPIGGGKYGRIYIHRAVCTLFNGPAPAPGMHVRHLDTDLSNNAASNLAWGTALENAEDARRAGKVCRGERNAMSRLTADDVRRMRDERAALGLTYKQLATKFGVSTMTAYRATVRQSWN